MSLGRNVPRLGVSALLIGALTLSACGGGSESKPSQKKVEQALRKDSTMSMVVKQLPKDKSDAVISCVAKALEDGASAGDLNDLVEGKKDLSEIKGPEDAVDAASEQAQNCVKEAVGG